MFAGLLVACSPIERIPAQTPTTAATCPATELSSQSVSLSASQTGRLAPGETICFGLSLERGEYTRLTIATEVGYLRARLLDPQGNELQRTWISSFSTAAPSLPLAIEAPASGLHSIQLSVPTWVPFTQAQTFTLEMRNWQSATVRAARQRELAGDARVRWLRDNAMRLRTVDPKDDDFSDLAFLRDVLRDTRVVLLGEGDNGGGTDVLAKTRLVKFLHQHMGFDVLAFQSNMFSATSAWRALGTGMAPRESVSKAGLALLVRSAEADALLQYLAEHVRTERPLELTGFDSQFTGTAGTTLMTELQAFLAARDIDSPFRDAQSPATRLVAGTIGGQFRSGNPLPSVDAQAQAADALRATALDLDRGADRDAARWAQILRSAAVQITLALNNARGASTNEFMSGFSRQMAENLQWIVRQGYPDRKIIVWAHTLQTVRNPQETSRTRALGYTVGHGLWEALGERSYTIALTSYRGRSHWITGAEDYYQDLIPGQHPEIDFETMMDAAGHELAFVDLRAARTRGGWLAGRFVASALHLVPEEATWGKMLDALLFIRTQAPRTRVR